MSNIYGYICTDTKEEAADLQKVMLKMGIPSENIFCDVLSNGSGRRNLKKVELKLTGEDLVYVKKLEWLGNSVNEILENWRVITSEKGSDVVVLDSPLLDTRRGSEFMKTLVSDVVEETLAVVTQYEHEKNSRAQVEAYLKSRDRGTRYGRPRAPLPENFASVCDKWTKGRITGVDAAKECGMPISTFRYRAKKYQEEKIK